MEAILSSLCEEMFGVKIRRGTPPLPRTGKLTELVPVKPKVNDINFDGRARKFLSRHHLAKHPRLRKGKRYIKDYIKTHEAYVPVHPLTEYQEHVVQQLMRVREETGLRNLPEAFRLATQLSQQMASDQSRFARHIEIYADMEIVSAGTWDGQGVPMLLRRQMRRIVERWIAENEWLNAAVALHEESLLTRTHSFVDHHASTKLIRKALSLLQGVEYILKAKCTDPGYKGVIALALLTQKRDWIRFHIDADEHWTISDRDRKELIDLAAAVGTPSARMDRDRALSVAYINSSPELAARYIIDGCTTHDYELLRKSPYSFLTWHARLLSYWVNTGHHKDTFNLAGIFRNYWCQYPEIHFLHQFEPLFEELDRPRADFVCPNVRWHYASRTSQHHSEPAFVRV